MRALRDVPANKTSSPLSSYMATLQQLLGSNFEKFRDDAWRAAPLHVSATPASTSAIAGLFDLDAFLSSVDDLGLFFGRDGCTARYIDGQRDSPGPGDGAPIRSQVLRELLADGATLQIHQPQRWSDSLHRLCFDMEKHFGCLVGANV